MDKPPDQSPSRAAPLYGQTRTPVLRPAWDLLERLAISPRERILITPAADGELLTLVASFHKEGKITGLEMNPARVRLCRCRVEQLEKIKTTVEILEAPPHMVPTPGGQDVFLSHCHLPQFVPGEAFARAVARNLRPGGRFAISIPATSFCRVLTESLVETLNSNPDWPAAEDLCLPVDPDDLGGHLEQLGFRQLEMTEKVYLQKFDTVMDAVHSLFDGGGWTGLGGMKDSARDLLAREMHLRMTRIMGTDQKVELPCRRLIAWGRR